MAATLKRLRLRAYCCPYSASSRCVSASNPPNPWHAARARQFSSTTGIKYPPPSSKGSDGPIIGENIAPERTQPGFWSMGEESDDLGGDEDFEGDDLTATGHAELDAHRELREFARIAAWEMPMLSKLAKPFTPPSKQQPLRLRYTTYLHERHPADAKVVLEFCPSDLPDLSPTQTAKLIKLAGARYDPATQIVKMSCDDHASQRANKASLLETLDALLKEARDPADTFEDVPFDFRHAEKRQRRRGEWLTFPEEWKMTEERRKLLIERREQMVLEDAQREEEGKLIDGGEVVRRELERSIGREPVMVEAGGRNTGGSGRTATRLR